MKISNLTETTLASMPNQAGAQAPTFDRDPNVLETTTSGSIGSIETPIGGMQRRGKGSMFSGIKSSKKFPNSVKEGAMPSSVIRIKEKIRMMTDAEKKEYFKGKTKEQLQQMARRHGYGENSNVYAKFATDSLAEEAPVVIDNPIHKIEYSKTGPQSAVKRFIKIRASSHDSAINALKKKLGKQIVIHTIATEKNMTEDKPVIFNDDDWYEINMSSNTIVRQMGPSAYQLPFGQREIKLPNGNVIMRGMRAKYIDGLKHDSQRT